MFFLWPIRLAVRLFELVVLAALVYLVVSAVQIVKASHLPTVATAAPHASAIVVLAAPLVGGSPGPDLLARLQQALALYQAQRAARVFVAGPAGPPSEPAAAKRWLSASGVPSSAIRMSLGGNAAAELQSAATRLGRGTSAIVVTDAIDAMWTEHVADGDGLVAVVSPAVGSERFVFDEFGALWRETSAVAAGRIIGFGRASWA